MYHAFVVNIFCDTWLLYCTGFLCLSIAEFHPASWPWTLCFMFSFLFFLFVVVVECCTNLTVCCCFEVVVVLLVSDVLFHSLLLFTVFFMLQEGRGRVAGLVEYIKQTKTHQIFVFRFLCHVGYQTSDLVMASMLGWPKIFPTYLIHRPCSVWIFSGKTRDPSSNLPR